MYKIAIFLFINIFYLHSLAFAGTPEDKYAKPEIVTGKGFVQITMRTESAFEDIDKDPSVKKNFIKMACLSPRIKNNASTESNFETRYVLINRRNVTTKINLSRNKCNQVIADDQRNSDQLELGEWKYSVSQCLGMGSGGALQNAQIDLTGSIITAKGDSPFNEEAFMHLTSNCLCGHHLSSHPERQIKLMVEKFNKTIIFNREACKK